ncbi:cbb3-type cytochrome oxidase assembly protein CcoS [Jeongeupia sp. USM3]|uniref:cbb3-type cytochrome oxidase assembly protein CcoS n=1 Tax=Jeongeupia sp. USM3 TaxID=1906741 RepID=UPI00089DF6FF|nr:cbb3-type cytochrome oxidase assembly protein CcoS [Jeongeupia sp. USM3]AOX99388.1 cytochrome oxidase maturation protein, cbb3-type [Jeongeupia sp. USM3]
MESLYLLIPLSVLLVVVIGALFWNAIRGGQFDDLEGPAHRILQDDDRPGHESPGNEAGREKNN